jgi:AmiR/NasT family two-component response regulator
MIMDKQAFLAGYMDKEGSVGSKSTALAGWLKDNAIALGIAAPVLAGIGTGALASHINSPSKLDQQSLQKKLHALELQEYRTELERRKALAKRKGINESSGETSTERSLRI